MILETGTFSKREEQKQRFCIVNIDLKLINQEQRSILTVPRTINQVAGAIFMFIVSKSMKGADKLKIKDSKFEIDELKSVS